MPKKLNFTVIKRGPLEAASSLRSFSNIMKYLILISAIFLCFSGISGIHEKEPPIRAMKR